MWEYKVVPVLMALYADGFPFDAARAKTINALGKKDWELVAIIEIGNKEHVAYFKRKIDA